MTSEMHPPSFPYAEDGPSSGGVLPRLFGKYTLLRRLAQGGMAEIYLALQRAAFGFEKLIVIKCILPGKSRDPAFIEMLLHEARIAASLSHPNIVQIFDVGEVDNTYYIAMEHIQGQDVRSIVRQMKRKGVSEFPLEHTLGIIMGQLAGLEYAHGKKDWSGAPLGIVHRDISPQNVIVTFSGDVKIVDFGVAKSTTQFGDETQSGQLKGKVPYMSPEQASGQPIDWRSDIFASGVMLFELTTGRRLFKRPSEFEALKAICESDYPRPTDIVPAYSPQLEPIVLRALAKNRADRYQSAGAMLADLERFARSSHLTVSRHVLSQWMQSLFEDTLLAQQESLQDIRLLADRVLAEQHSPPSGSEATFSSLHAPPPSARTISPVETPLKRRGSRWAVAWITACFVALATVLLLTFGLERASVRDRPPSSSGAVPESSSDVPMLKGKLHVSSDPGGAAIWVNGKQSAEPTPTTLTDLPLGQGIAIKVIKDGFDSAMQYVSLTPNHAEETVHLPLKKPSVSLSLHVIPPDAELYLDGRPLFATEIQGLSPWAEHVVTAAATGYSPKTIGFRSPAGRKAVDISLERARGKGSSPAFGITDAVSGRPPPAEGQGRLTVVAWGGSCAVTVDTAVQTTTPVNDLVVPAGYHSVTCKTESGKTLTQSANVEAGQVARVGFIVD